MMPPRFALTFSVAVQVLLVYHSSIVSFPVAVGATATTSSNSKEGEGATTTSVLRPGRRGLKKSSQEVAGSTALGATSDNEQHHILKKKEVPKVVVSNAPDQAMQEDVVLGDKINMIHKDDNKDIREDFDSDENFASELPDMTPPTKSAGITTRQLNQIGQEVLVYDGYWGDWGSWVGSRSGNWAACGAELRVKSPQANGIRFRFCGLNTNGNSWNSQYDVEPASGIKGDWTGMKMCPGNKYIGAAIVKSQRVNGVSYDEALNGLAIWCVDKYWRGGSSVIVFRGYEGDWKEWEYVKRKIVSQVQARSDDISNQRYGSKFGEDKGLNGIRFLVK